MIAELIAKITADVSDLNKAEVALKQFQHNVNQVFKRAPSGEMRAEMALGGAVRQLVSGDVGGAIESVTHRLGIMGVAGGVAVASLIVAFTKAREAAKKYEEALKDAEKASRVSPSAASGLQALQADLIKTAALQGKLAHDIDSQWVAMGRNVGRLGSILKETFLEGGAFTDPAGRHNAEDRVKNAETLERISLHTSDAMRRQADAAKNASEIARLTAIGDQEGVETAKRKERHQVAIYQAAKDYHDVLDATQDKATRQAIKPELQAARSAKEVSAQAIEEAEEAAAVTKAALAQEELTTSAQISAVKEQGLSADVEKNVLAVINIQHLQAQLKAMEGIVGTTKDAKQAELERAIAEDQGRKKKEATAKVLPTFEAHAQLSLEELAKMPRRGWLGGSLDTQIVQAQEVQKLMKRSEAERLAGHTQESFALFARAEEFKRGMPLLRESEKSPEMAFLTALNSATVFTSMVDYLKTIASAVETGNPFLNK